MTDQPGRAASFRTEVPALRPGLIHRPRLLMELAGRFDRRLTVVVAGAGYGKTTLLSQAIEDNRLDPQGLDVWFQAGEADRSPSYLVAGLADALGGDAELAVGVDDLCELVLLRAPESIALVIDDAHLLGDSVSWDIVAGLLEALPQNGHLVLGSRTMPPLSTRRLQARGQAVVVDESALSFTAEELDRLGDVLGDPAVAASLPGWPALAVLAGTAGHDASLGYLWEEILRDLPPERQRALALVSRLDRFDDELVAAAVGPQWTAASLVDGLPLVDVVGSGRRLHDLWRAALADVVRPAEWRPAMAAAAQVHLGRNDLVRAVAALRDAGDDDRVVALARQYVSLPISAGLSRAEAEVLLDQLPPSAREGAIGKGLASILLWTPGEVRQALDEMLAHAAEAGDDEMRALGWWRVVQLQGDTDPAGLSVPPELQRLADDGWPLARSAVALVRSHDAQEERDVETALSVLDDLGGPHPQTRRVALASRHLALGHPELVPVTLDDVLAEAVSDPVAAQAVWFRGDIDPDVAWPIAAELPATYGARRLAAVEVPLLSMVASVALSVAAFEDARLLTGRALDRTRLVAPRLAVFANVADALVALADEGDEGFAERLGPALDRVPLGPWPAWAYLGALAPIRALLPDVDWLDDLDLGVSMAAAVAAGRAVAELRAGHGPAAALALPWSAPPLLRVHVPLPLLCELALAAVEVPEAAGMLEAMPSVSRWARRLRDHPDAVVRERAGALAARVPLRPDHDLRITTFGGLGVARSDGVAVAGLERRRRLRQVLARLVVERSVPRVRLGEELWPDLAPEHAANNLRVTLAKLLAVLEPDRGDGHAWSIRSVGDNLELADEGVHVDVDVFDRHLREARAAERQGASTVAYDHYREALALYRGEYLAGIDESFAVHERIRLQSLAYGAACRLAEFEVARGEPEVAMDHATAAIRIDGLGERAYRLMIGCHLALGATDAARVTAELLAERQRSAGETADVDVLRRLARFTGG